MQADFQITPMLAQELFGPLQGCVLGRMRCPHGLTTNAPDHNELLYHLSFPEPMKRPFGWSNHTPEPGDRPTNRLINLFPFLPVVWRSPVARASDLAAQNYEARSAQESTEANLFSDVRAFPAP